MIGRKGPVINHYKLLPICGEISRMFDGFGLLFLVGFVSINLTYEIMKKKCFIYTLIQIRKFYSIKL